jgi:hypothetical protein
MLLLNSVKNVIQLFLLHYYVDTLYIVMDLVFPTQRPPKICGTSDVIAATQRLLKSS